MKPRYYQIEASEATQAEWAKGNRKTLIVMPTGTGKTITFSAIIQDRVRMGERCLILAHRQELLDQAAKKLGGMTGLGCAVEKAESTCINDFFRVVVGSVQTMMREKRLATFPRDFFDTIIVDEAHHVLADSYQRILAHFENANILGVTATPDRGDMRELGEFFDSMAYEYSLPKAIKEGFLCPIKALTIPITLDLTGVSVRGGDYRAEEVGNALDPYLHQIADEMVEHCRGRRSVVFLPLIATSQKFCEILREKGIRAAEVNGQSTDRTEILADFERGAYDVLCNSMLLTEGWDCPPVDCIVCLRPTKIRSLYCQIVGRGTRIHDGKDHLLLLDFLWLSAKHELCRPAHLLAYDDKIADKMTEQIIAAGCPVDLEEAEQQAEGDSIAEREEALRKRLAEQRNKKRKLVDPLQYEMSIHSMDLSDYEPSFGWEAKPPTEQQVKQLETAGILADELDAGKAERLLTTIDRRRSSGLSTPKQIRFLERKGFRDVGTWGFSDARKLIDRIAGNNWRIPGDINPAKYQPKQQEKISA
jgi:superfamily II DNA or RNA helicase